MSVDRDVRDLRDVVQSIGFFVGGNYFPRFHGSFYNRRKNDFETHCVDVYFILHFRGSRCDC